MNFRYPDYLLHSSAMLNAAIRVLRTIDEEQYKDSIQLWSEQVKRNMALLNNAPDPDNVRVDSKTSS